ncbi:hypothetical protein EYC84_005957 [Monilinia fructicola]|uniref:Uncharacterized protein n=1 Tax=Monilinia fructicola TaxID=38448 RepID=A0A5M9K156_MONFR|nr:hypothetical protein EYC84_005957 [Monilinia fructicola]
MFSFVNIYDAVQVKDQSLFRKLKISSQSDTSPKFKLPSPNIEFPICSNPLYINLELIFQPSILKMTFPHANQ